MIRIPIGWKLASGQLAFAFGVQVAGVVVLSSVERLALEGGFHQAILLAFVQQRSLSSSVGVEVDESPWSQLPGCSLEIPAFARR